MHSHTYMNTFRMHRNCGGRKFGELQKDSHDRPVDDIPYK